MDMAHVGERKIEKLFSQASASPSASSASVEDDDDVQFISCAPRRREETKRPTVLKPASDASYSSPTTYNEAAASTTSKTDHVLRRGSTGMDQRLKSYHLGEGEGKAVSVRSGSLPTAYAVGTISPISPLPLPTSLEPENSQPWTNSKFGSQITNMAPGWRPVHFGGTQRPNSRQGEDPVELSLESYSRNDPPLVSPKTISASIAYPIQDAFSALSYTDMLHSSGMPYGTEFEIPECSMADSRPQSHSPPMTNTSSPFGFRSKTPLLPQGLNQSLSSTHHIPKGVLQSQLRQTTDLFTQRRGSDHISSQNVTVPRDEEVPIYNNSRSFPTQIPRQATKVPQSHSASSSSQMLPPDTNTRTPDVLRNPSLYTIPAWPSSTMQTLPLTPLNNPKSHTNLPSMVCRGYQIVNNGQFDSNPKRPYPNLQIQTPLTGSVSQYQVQLETSNGNEDQPPRKKVRHRHAQNLIVDIAETCQEMFPFAAVAQRHGQPIQKIFDTFSAIIQLPLLRNADDRRRHGSLGKRRVKEYKDAKRAMEKSREAERKARLRVSRASAECSDPKKEANSTSKSWAPRSGDSG